MFGDKVEGITCPICQKEIEFVEDLVFIGSPKEIAICYWCLRNEIIPLARNMGARPWIKSHSNDGQTIHLGFQPDTDFLMR